MGHNGPQFCFVSLLETKHKLKCTFLNHHTWINTLGDPRWPHCVHCMRYHAAFKDPFTLGYIYKRALKCIQKWQFEHLNCHVNWSAEEDNVIGWRAPEQSLNRACCETVLSTTVLFTDTKDVLICYFVCFVCVPLLYWPQPRATFCLTGRMTINNLEMSFISILSPQLPVCHLSADIFVFYNLKNLKKIVGPCNAK